MPSLSYRLELPNVMVSNTSNMAVIAYVLHLSVVRLAAAVHETLSPFMTEIRMKITETVTKELKKTADYILEQAYECGV